MIKKQLYSLDMHDDFDDVGSALGGRLMLYEGGNITLGSGEVSQPLF